MSWYRRAAYIYGAGFVSTLSVLSYIDASRAIKDRREILALPPDNDGYKPHVSGTELGEAMSTVASNMRVNITLSMIFPFVWFTGAISGFALYNQPRPVPYS